MSVIDANSADPDQTPRSAASDLGLRCLPKSLLWDTRHKWVKFVRITLQIIILRIYVCFHLVWIFK